MTTERSQDAVSIEAAARFAAEQSGWIDRVRGEHTRRPDGSCAGCGSYRLVRWPCVLIDIAGLAERIPNRRAPRPAEPPAGGRCPTDPAASRPSPQAAVTEERPAAGPDERRGVA